jgi:Rtf2 RING-finger
MGGDGGTKAVHRAYLRGAGSASTTGDHPANNRSDKQITEQEANRAMQYCYITDQPLHYDTTSSSSSSSSSSYLSSNIVTCRYGRLYNKEAAIEALLHRKQQSKVSATASSGTSTNATGSTVQSRLGMHVRGLKDLYNVRFLTTQNDVTNVATVMPVCPITGRELNGKIIAFALIPGNDNIVNVISEYALKRLSESEILIEYGARKKIRLLAPPSLHGAIDQEYIEDESNTTTQKSKKKRKLQHEKRDTSEQSDGAKKQSSNIANAL